MIIPIKRQVTQMRFISSIAIFIFCLMANPLGATAEQPANTIEELAKQAQSKLEEQPLESVLRPDIEYKAEDLRDPFKGYIAEKEEPRIIDSQSQEQVSLPSLTVQGIIWGSGLPQAIINNKVVKIGDTIEGTRIINIDKDGVTVFFNYRQYILSSPAAVNQKGGNDEE